MNKYTVGEADIHLNIRKIMQGRKRGLKCYEIRDLYFKRFGKYYSESGFSARLREMNDIKCNLSDNTYLMETK